MPGTSVMRDATCELAAMACGYPLFPRAYHVAYWLAKYIIDATTTTSSSTKDRDRATFCRKCMNAVAVNSTVT